MADIETKRHSLAHILAMAVLDLWPDAKLGIGPAIENGFYYDFDFDSKEVGLHTASVGSLTSNDLPKIEKQMREILEKAFKFEWEEISVEEAEKIFANQPYKLELIKEISGSPTSKKLSIYKSGGFVDLCAGPHVDSTKDLKNIAFKLAKIAGAYWKGSEKNPMLTRIYGLAFETKKELDDYLKIQEEAEKRDHIKIGKEQDLFAIYPDSVGSGLVHWHPKGAIIRHLIEELWRKEHDKRNYQYVYTPHIGKINLWKISGHLDFYKHNMYPPMKLDEDEYLLKPMNCPFHVQIYNSKMRSYRDLPIRYCEIGTVYRPEKGGELRGLTRVRTISQDDSHIFCREDQLEQEIKEVMDFGLSLLKMFGFKDFIIELSVRGLKDKTKYLGGDKAWNIAENALANVLRKLKVEYERMEGEAAFYGPKIDVHLKDALGRKWQCMTIQVDFNFPEKFGLNHVGEDGKKHKVIMIHRTLLGCMERFFGVLIEHYAGAFPVWLAPVQTQIMAVSDKFNDYARKIFEILKKENLRIEFNDNNETVSKKIRQGELQKIPYILVVGEKEKKSNTVRVRQRQKGDLGEMKLDDFIEKIKLETEQKSL
jgi:threonyl-tRNA synthetase